MEQQLLIADADGFLSDIYRKYFAAHGYSVRVASGGVECLTALRETPPDVLVLDSELKWGGAHGVLAVMDEDDGLSTVPIVLLNELDGKVTDETDPPAWLSFSASDVGILKWPDGTSMPSPSNGRKQLPLPAQVVDHLLKPFRLQELLDSIGAAVSRPTQPR